MHISAKIQGVFTKRHVD